MTNRLQFTLMPKRDLTSRERAAAEGLIWADPFHQAGVFVPGTVRPWTTIFGNPALLPPNG